MAIEVHELREPLDRHRGDGHQQLLQLVPRPGRGFVDEASTNCVNEPYYATLASYVKSKGGVGLTVLNPGTQTNRATNQLLTFSLQQGAQCWIRLRDSGITP